jgi:hypothetical protein
VLEHALPDRIDIVRAKRHLLGQLGDGQPCPSFAIGDLDPIENGYWATNSATAKLLMRAARVPPRDAGGGSRSPHWPRCRAGQ